MAAPLLELTHITHRFGTTVALDAVSLRVHAGRVHAVLGENGAGKTTLLRTAFGMIHPDAGTILVDGAATTLRAPADAIAHGIGMVHQHFTLVPAMTVAENIALGGRGRFDAAQVARHIERLGQVSGLHVSPLARVESLSIHQQQRVEILKAIARDARVLIMDEPTAVLAPEESDELLGWLRRFVAEGRAVVLITHKLREALAIADDVTVLRQGRVAVHGPARTMDIDALTDAMLGERATEQSTSSPASPPRPTARDVAEAREVSIARGRERIRAASLAIRAGEIVGVAGIEGSGHHLLLRMLAGRLAPDVGSMRLPSRIGFIPEDRLRDALVADDTLPANLALKGAGARRGPMHWRSWRYRAAELVARHDVRGVRGGADRTVVRALSGGNQQKFILARELDDAPELIVAENPTRGLDIRASALVLEALRAAAANGAGVLLYSADLDEVFGIAHRVIVVAAGYVRDCGTDRELVGRAMLGLA